jgi:hypothetical protein
MGSIHPHTGGDDLSQEARLPGSAAAREGCPKNVYKFLTGRPVRAEVPPDNGLSRVVLVAVTATPHG